MYRPCPQQVVQVVQVVEVVQVVQVGVEQRVVLWLQRRPGWRV